MPGIYNNYYFNCLTDLSLREQPCLIDIDLYQILPDSDNKSPVNIFYIFQYLGSNILYLINDLNHFYHNTTSDVLIRKILRKRRNIRKGAKRIHQNFLIVLVFEAALVYI